MNGHQYREGNVVFPVVFGKRLVSFLVIFRTS